MILMDRSSNIGDGCRFCDKIEGDIYDHWFKECYSTKNG